MEIKTKGKNTGSPWNTSGRNAGTRAHMEQLGNKEGATQTFILKGGKVNKTQVTPIREGQTIRNEGKRRKRGSIK